MKVNPNRPVEELVGPNRGITRELLGNVHCMRRVLDQAREVRPYGGLRAYPVELRRGWALCVLQTIRENRSCYIGVVTGNLRYKAPIGAFS